MASTGTKTTIKLATLTAAAKDDVFSGTEDNIASVNLSVLANDPGSASLYSVWQPVAEANGTTPATSNQLPIETSATLPSGAIITMNGDGTVNYDAGNAFQHLGDGDTATDTFSYTVRMANGALSTASVTITIQGVNDAATISGVNAGTITEDGTLSASGSLSVNDADDGENGFQAVDENALTGAYGSFTFNNGAWTFEGDNAAAQHLGDGDSDTQTLTVTSLDGTATETITVTIQGINDTAAISGNAAGTVTEDGILSASGSLLVSDADDGEAGFQAVSGGDLAGTYGDFTFDSLTGAWGYSLRNGDSNVQDLNAGDVVYDTLTVKSLDGSADQEIKVTINGENDVVSLIDFEDITIDGYFEIPDGYHGFNWDVPYGINLYTLYGPGLVGSGYAVAGTNVAYTPWAYQPVVITRTDGGDFDFGGVELTSAWDSVQTVTLEGWLDGSLIYSDTVTIYNTSVTDVNENWGAIDTLIIGNNFATYNSHLVLDNFDLVML